MKISNPVSDMQHSLNVQTSVLPNQASRANSPKRAATVTSSSPVEETKLTTVECLSGSDTRARRLEAIKKAIAANAYNVPASAVADKLIESMVR
jgi:anti-sigma28 factor (negative regulator of flagellin synthesis)